MPSASNKPDPAEHKRPASQASDNSIVRQSDQPVSVPRTPNPRKATDDEAQAGSHPPKDDSGGSNWADGVEPAPNKRKARTHQL